ncbi:MAG: NAD-glutamate dehydrogenase [Simkaniaceae bacterium]
MPDKKVGRLTKAQLELAMQNESRQFEEYYLWIEKHMPPSFFEEVEQSNVMIIAHNLMGFPLQEHFIQIHFKDYAVVLCLDSPDADLKILKNYSLYGIKNYQTFISDEPPPFANVTQRLRIALIYFTVLEEPKEFREEIVTDQVKRELYEHIKRRNPELTKAEFEELIGGMNARFIRSLTTNRLILALDMFLRARTRDHCQYEVRYNKNWQEKETRPSLQIVLAWRNTPKHRFLYRLAKTIYRHNLSIKMVNATYIKPYSKNSILIMSLGLHGANGKAAWEETNIHDFLQEMVTLKYFSDLDSIEDIFIDTGLIRGNLGNFLRTAVNFVHQALVHADINLYSPPNIEEALCRHPELTVMVCKAFELKFHPENSNIEEYERLKSKFLNLVNRLDTGHEVNDVRRKNVLKQAMNFVEFTLKTNFYRNNKSALCYRIDPNYLKHLPYETSEKFPEIPYAIFFAQGMYFIAFHIRFKDISRGGLRTVFPQRLEQMMVERNNVFSECYNLAYTQQKKNKDIPEGGSKGVIFLEPYERLQSEADIYKKELAAGGVSEEAIEKKIQTFKTEQKIQYLHQTQRAFIHSLMTLVNFDQKGVLKAKHVSDYWRKREYIYLGPDENMHNEMIDWIAEYSKHCHYEVGSAFISSKPKAGINHKEYGVTSLGVNVYMHQVLLHLGIDPEKDAFTVKISGGPDGDVAGNQILNLHKYYPKTAKLVAITDVSGTIYDPEGLDLHILSGFFHEGKPIRFYPPKKLHDNGYLLDMQTKREHSAYATQTLFYKKADGKLIEEWLGGSDMNHLFRESLHQKKTDIFIPAGGRPRTLNEHNWTDFLDETGRPTSRAIIEGANLYLTQGARTKLEELGTIIIKDSSANKGGVICSSFEVLSGLVLSDEEFIKEKPGLMDEILYLIAEKAKDEAELMLRTHSETGAFLTDISEWISERINTYTYQLLESLENQKLSRDPADPLIQCLFNYCPPLFREKYADRIISHIPESHKRAIISCYIASKIVYKKGLRWSPTIADVLPLVATDPTIIAPTMKKHKVDVLPTVK